MLLVGTVMMTYRDPGALQLATPTITAEFIEVTIGNIMCIELRVDRNVVRISTAAWPSERSRVLWEESGCDR